MYKGLVLCMVMVLGGCQSTPRHLITPSTNLNPKTYDKLITLRKIKDKIYASQGWADDGITIHVIKDIMTVNAYADLYKNRILFTSGMVWVLETEDRLAAILGHELGHFKMNHKERRHSLSTRDKELEADELGAAIAHKAGYNMCGVYKYHRTKHINTVPTGDYPTSKERMEVYVKYIDVKQCLADTRY